ncbi:MAG: ACT domain-containing protein [Anaerolineae bacterium]|nr:ACT domain-containing protein [Anaerolineae bacterium]NIN94020.1 ACT domain-containing protein [Anaerolineae bacterium]
MATDLTVILEDRPGTLADLGETLGRAGVNIDGLCAFTSEGKGEIHILVEDAAVARSALQGAGMEVRGEREVLVVPAEDRPGMLGEIARKVADAGVNINLAYLATNTRVVLSSEDLEGARRAL